MKVLRTFREVSCGQSVVNSIHISEMYISMFFGSFLYKGASHLNMLCGQLSSNPRKPRSSHPCAYVVHVFAMRRPPLPVNVLEHYWSNIQLWCDIWSRRWQSCIEKVSSGGVRNLSCGNVSAKFQSLLKSISITQEKFWEISSWSRFALSLFY